MLMLLLWVVRPCRPVGSYRRFGETLTVSESPHDARNQNDVDFFAAMRTLSLTKLDKNGVRRSNLFNKPNFIEWFSVLQYKVLITKTPKTTEASFNTC